uniref:Serpin domain-containing protein n=1 Tax=Triticum urartu TaxID=4572 RepID=A0A8R7PMN9_TRIUA
MYQQIACHDGFRVLKLPYKSFNDDSPPAYNSKPREGLPEFSMCVFLPEDRDGLRSLVGRITARPKFLHEHLPRDHVPVGKFRLPKFKLMYMNNIRNVLKDLGLQLPFNRVLANMAGIVGDD